MKRSIDFTEAALEALAGLNPIDRGFVLNGIRTHLRENDPAEVTRNKFRLKRPSPHAARELRLGKWRVFYSVMEEGRLVTVNLIGEKRGNRLLIGGTEWEI